jgi:hypothetical protein
MKGLILRMVASASLKLGIAYSLKIIILAIAGLRGVLAEGNISDENRITISRSIAVLLAVRDFLSKFADLIGSPPPPAYASAHGELEKLAQGLDKITDSL